MPINNTQESLYCSDKEALDIILSDSDDSVKRKLMKERFNETVKDLFIINRWMDTQRSMLAFSSDYTFKVAHTREVLESVQGNISMHDFQSKHKVDWQNPIDNKLIKLVDEYDFWYPMKRYEKSLQSIMEDDNILERNIAAAVLMNFLDIKEGKEYFLKEIRNFDEDIKINFPTKNINNLVQRLDGSKELEIIKALDLLLDKGRSDISLIDINYGFKLGEEEYLVKDLIREYQDLKLSINHIEEVIKEGWLKTATGLNIDSSTTNMLYTIYRIPEEKIYNVRFAIGDHPRLIKDNRFRALRNPPPQIAIGWLHAATEILISRRGYEHLRSNEQLQKILEFTKSEFIESDRWELATKEEFLKNNKIDREKHDYNLSSPTFLEFFERSEKYTNQVKTKVDKIFDSEYSNIRISKILFDIAKLYYNLYHAKNMAKSEGLI